MQIIQFISRVKNEHWVIAIAGACIGVSAFFFLVPFIYARSYAEFSGWLEGLAGPLGFVTISLIAYTSWLQLQQHERTDAVEQALVCERLLETFQHLMGTAEIISVQQNAAQPEYRKGARAFALIKAEYDRRVSVIQDESARTREESKFIRTHKHNVEPFIRVIRELKETASVLSATNNGRANSIKQRTLAVVLPDARRMLVLLCDDQHRPGLKQWLDIP